MKTKPIMMYTYMSEDTNSDWSVRSAGVIILLAYNQETFGINPELGEILEDLVNYIPDKVKNLATSQIEGARQLAIATDRMLTEVDQILKENP